MSVTGPSCGTHAVADRRLERHGFDLHTFFADAVEVA
jgi:hypothetical protein